MLSANIFLLSLQRKIVDSVEQRRSWYCSMDRFRYVFLWRICVCASLFDPRLFQTNKSLIYQGYVNCLAVRIENSIFKYICLFVELVHAFYSNSHNPPYIFFGFVDCSHASGLFYFTMSVSVCYGCKRIEYQCQIYSLNLVFQALLSASIYIF